MLIFSFSFRLRDLVYIGFSFMFKASALAGILHNRWFAKISVFMKLPNFSALHRTIYLRVVYAAIYIYKTIFRICIQMLMKFYLSLNILALCDQKYA